MKKLYIGLFENQICLQWIGNSIPVSNRNVILANVMARKMDEIYQEIKIRNRINDKTYIAFEYEK